MGIFKPLVEAAFDDFRLQVEANLYGVFHFSKAVLQGMIKNKKGSIINICSWCKAEKRNILHPSDAAETVAAILKMPSRALISEVDIRPSNPK